MDVRLMDSKILQDVLPESQGTCSLCGSETNTAYSVGTVKMISIITHHLIDFIPPFSLPSKILLSNQFDVIVEWLWNIDCLPWMHFSLEMRKGARSIWKYPDSPL